MINVRKLLTAFLLMSKDSSSAKASYLYSFYAS